MTEQVPLNRVRLAFTRQQLIFRFFLYPLDAALDADAVAKCHNILDQLAVEVVLQYFLDKVPVNLHDITGQILE